jgi:phospholipase/carboxylesterase
VNDELLPCVELEPESGVARASVIWLHGLGADGHDFEPIVPELRLDPALGVRFVFPHAPRIPVTLNAGMVMPAWYDITESDLRRRNDEEGVLRSHEQVRLLVEREIDRGVPTERIVLAGFSQGGAIALHLGLRFDRPLAGILALSTYLVRGDTLESEAHGANRATPIFQAHGAHDPMVPIDRALEARDRLKELGYELFWQRYPMQHEVCWDELQAVGGWLSTRLGEPHQG